MILQKKTCAAPNLQRWLNRDPLGYYSWLFKSGFKNEVNLYLFSNNAALNWSDPDGEDATSWYGDGRTLSDGPKNGNWGGQNWCGGQNPNNHGGKSGNKPPTDSADNIYMNHDKCYDNCNNLSDTPTSIPSHGRNAKGESPKQKCMDNCDRNLVNDLKKLPRDPQKWPVPPRKGTKDDTSSYRDNAIWWFGK